MYTVDVQSISTTDRHRLRAAAGWLRLGNVAEAYGELTGIAPEQHRHPVVLDLRWHVLAAAGRWRECYRVARHLTVRSPANPKAWLQLAESLNRLGRTKQAYSLLKRRSVDFSTNAAIHYDLARYACRLDMLDKARCWITAALGLANDHRVTEAARLDTDLFPLWEYMSA